MDVVSQQKRQWPPWLLVLSYVCLVYLVVDIVLNLAISFTPFSRIDLEQENRIWAFLAGGMLFILAVVMPLLIRFALPLYSSPIRVFACLTTRLLAQLAWWITGWRLFVLLLLLFALGGNAISQRIPPREERNSKPQPGKPAPASTWKPLPWNDVTYWTDPSGYLAGIGLFAILGSLLGVMRTRSRIVIDEFAYYSGDMESSVTAGAEDKRARGVASMLSNYLVLTSGLYHDVNEQRVVLIPGVDLSVHDANIKTEGVNTQLDNLVSKDTTLSLGPFKVPIGALLALVGNLVRSPRIVGSLHRIEDSQGVRHLLQARLINYSYALAWQVDSREPSETLDKSFRSELEQNELKEEEVALYSGNQTPSQTEPQASGGKSNAPTGSRSFPDRVLDDLVSELASRIFTDLALKSAVRWRATCHFTQALRQYRHCLRTPEDRKLKLRKAEREIMKTLGEDEQFNWAFYNLGLIYTGLGQKEAAQAAFNRSIERQNPPQWETYYALAQNYYEQDPCGNYLYIVGLCEQVVSLKPNEARAYRLLSLAERDQANYSLKKAKILWEEAARLREEAKNLSNAVRTRHAPRLSEAEKLWEEAKNLKEEAKKHKEEEATEKEREAQTCRDVALEHLKAAQRSGEDAVAWSWHALCTEHLRYRFRPPEENRLEQVHATARDCLHALALACMERAFPHYKENIRYRNRHWRKACWLLWQSRFVVQQNVEISQTRGRLWLFASIWYKQIKGWDAFLLKLCYWTDCFGRKYEPLPNASNKSDNRYRTDAIESFREALKINQDVPQNWIYLYLALAADKMRRWTSWKECLDRACNLTEPASRTSIEDYRHCSPMFENGSAEVEIERLQTIYERNKLFNKARQYQQEGWPAIGKLEQDYDDLKQDYDRINWELEDYVDGLTLKYAMLRQEGYVVDDQPSDSEIVKEHEYYRRKQEGAWKLGILATALLAMDRNRNGSMTRMHRLSLVSCDNMESDPTSDAIKALKEAICDQENKLHALENKPPKESDKDEVIWQRWKLAQGYLCLGRLCFERDDRPQDAGSEYVPEGHDLDELVCLRNRYGLEEKKHNLGERIDPQRGGSTKEDTILFLKRAIWLLEQCDLTYQLRDQALYAYYAEALRRCGYRSPALYEAERSLQKDPMSGYERSIYAQIYNSYHELGRAYEAWHGALAWSADNPQYYLHMGHTAFEAALRCRTPQERQKELMLAGEHYQNVLMLLDEGNCYEKGCAHHFLGRVLYELNRPVKAAPHFEIATTLGFARVKSTYWVCWTLLRARLYSECFAMLPRLKNMIDEDPCYKSLMEALQQADVRSQAESEGAQKKETEQQIYLRKLSLLESEADSISFEEIMVWYHLMSALCCAEGRLYDSSTPGHRNINEDLLKAGKIVALMEDVATQRRCRKIWYCYQGWVDYLNWMANQGNGATEADLTPIIQTMRRGVGMDAYPEACIRLAFVTMRLLDMRPGFPEAVGIRLDMTEHLRQVKAADLRDEFKEEKGLIEEWLKKPVTSPGSALPSLAVVGTATPTRNSL